MSRYTYETVKFRYVTDKNEVLFRVQRLYIDGNGDYLTPKLQVLLDHRVLTDWVSNQTELSGLRHFVVERFVGESLKRFKVYIPPRPGTTGFREAFSQIKAHPDVQCFHYQGERFSNV
ncbi:MAG: hypothetical protein AAGA60_30985 [Cyanobacteria bacterium P01_E01_bin.42]